MQNMRPEHASVEVNLDALQHNTELLGGKTSAGCRQMAVIKANAYGHGATEVARSLAGRVAWFAVNDVDEGAELRKAGIEEPILVFGVPGEQTAPAYEKWRLTASVGAPAHIEPLPPGTDYHLNVDSGMGRLGFRPEETAAMLEAVNRHSGPNCTGIYSHFATADDPGSEYAERQLERFRTVRERFDDSLLTHMANTGGTLYYPGSHFDMVRNGIGIYGYPPGETAETDLRPVMALKATLVQMKRVEAGDVVSYGARWKAHDRVSLGVIPLGYEEGIPRVLSGNLEVAVGGELRPVVGTVTMNYIMVDLGPETRVSEGDEVVVMGEEALDAGVWAERSGTIPYEILSGISASLPRIFTRDS